MQIQVKTRQTYFKQIKTTLKTTNFNKPNKMLKHTTTIFLFIKTSKHKLNQVKTINKKKKPI